MATIQHLPATHMNDDAAREEAAADPETTSLPAENVMSRALVIGVLVSLVILAALVAGYLRP